jgi:hypothetical protein
MVLLAVVASTGADFDDPGGAWAYVFGVGIVLGSGSPFVFWIAIPSFLAWRRFSRWLTRRLNLEGIAKGLTEGTVCFLAGLVGAFIGLVLVGSAISPEENVDPAITGKAQAVVGLFGLFLALGSPFVFWIAIPGFLTGRVFWRWLHREGTATEGPENTCSNCGRATLDANFCNWCGATQKG